MPMRCSWDKTLIDTSAARAGLWGQCRNHPYELDTFFPLVPSPKRRHFSCVLSERAWLCACGYMMSNGAVARHAGLVSLIRLIRNHVHARASKHSFSSTQARGEG